MLVVDIDRLEVPAAVLTRAGLRYVFVCSDTHRRRLQQFGKADMFASLPDYAVVTKPVKRQELWGALLSRGQRYEAERKRADHPLAASLRRRRHKQDAARSSAAAASGTMTSSEGTSTLGSTAAGSSGANTGTAASMAAAARTAAAGTRILLVEDNPTNVMVCAAVISACVTHGRLRPGS